MGVMRGSRGVRGSMVYRGSGGKTMGLKNILTITHINTHLHTHLHTCSHKHLHMRAKTHMHAHAHAPMISM